MRVKRPFVVAAVVVASLVAAGSLYGVWFAPPANAVQCVGPPSDFNGDGRPDLAVGEPGRGLTDFDGAVRVLYGSASGLDRGAVNSQFFSNLSAGLPSDPDSTSAFFGTALASGYFDADCQADLAIGTISNEVVVLYGRPTGLSTARSQRFTAAAVAPAGQTGNWFGSALAAGDFNRDGRADLAIGARFMGTPVAGGAVAVLYGSNTGLTATGAGWFTQDSPGVPDTVEALDRFGAALAAGDFEGDGFADLAVGVAGESVGAVATAGAVAVLRGSSAGLSGSGATMWHQGTAGVPGEVEANDRFGSALAAGDLTGDGRADLAVGVPNQVVGGFVEAGYVNVLFGSATGITAAGAQGWSENSAGVPGTAGERDAFGYAVTIGDFNRDRRGDLAIGAPGQEIGVVAQAGTVTVLPGTTTGPTSAGAALWHQDSPGVANANDPQDRFGEAVHVVKGRTGEFDALAVGAPESANAEDADNNGALIVLQGSSAGVTGAGSASWTPTQLTGGVPAGGHLGSPLA